MGSKKVKAIAVRGTGAVKIARPEEFREAAREARERLIAQTKANKMPPHALDPRKVELERGCLEGKNYQTGVLPQFVENIGQHVARKYFSKVEGACYACPIGCKPVIHLDTPGGETQEAPGPEYETCASFGTMIMNDNLDDMEGLLKLAKHIGANFMVQPYSDIKTGDASKNHPAAVSERLLELHGKYPNFLSNPNFLKRFDEAARGKISGCMAGRVFFNIDNYGNVAKCVEHRQTPIGNVIHDPISELLKRLKQENRSNKCQACWYNCRGEIESLYTFQGLKASLPMLAG